MGSEMCIRDRMTMDEEGYGDDSNLHVEAKFEELGDSYSVCPYLIDLALQNGSRPDSIEYLMNKFLKFAADEKGYVVPE